MVIATFLDCFIEMVINKCIYSKQYRTKVQHKQTYADLLSNYELLFRPQEFVHCESY